MGRSHGRRDGRITDALIDRQTDRAHFNGPPLFRDRSQECIYLSLYSRPLTPTYCGSGTGNVVLQLTRGTTSGRPLVHSGPSML